MGNIISLIIIPILFLAHIVMSGMLIKGLLKEIKHLRSELEELYANGLAQLKANINLKKEILELKQERVEKESRET